MSAAINAVMPLPQIAPTTYVRLPWSFMFRLSDALDDVEQLLMLARSRGAGTAATRRRLVALASGIDAVLADALHDMERLP